MPPFIPGLQLADRFYHEAVKLVLVRRFPALVYSAARLDFGSDVLGFDTPQSMDHDWGPKCTLFVTEQDYDAYREQINEAMGRELPFEIAGFPTHYARNENGTRTCEAAAERPIDHWVTITTMRRFFEGYLGVNPIQGLQDIDWLTIPQQRLRTVASGKVFHDGLGQLEPARALLRWYPRDVWLYLLANQWRRIDQEEPFMARCGDAGDELGSRLVAARLVRELMRLCFLIEQQYAPYIKWFGTAFARLRCAGELSPIFMRVLAAEDWHAREQHLSRAYIAIMRWHNVMLLTTLDARVTPFHTRPYLVPQSDRFVQALRAAIESPAVRGWPPFVGALDQFVDSSDLLDSPEDWRRLAQVYAQ